MAATGVIVDRLRDILGDQVIVDTDMVASYTTDWTGRFAGHTMAVVRPASTDRWPGWSRPAGSWVFPWYPREATPGWWAAAFPSTARWS